jgi:hypothetical protein
MFPKSRRAWGAPDYVQSMMKVYESDFIDYVGLNIYQPHFWTNLNLWNLGPIHILQPREGKSSAVASNGPE